MKLSSHDVPKWPFKITFRYSSLLLATSFLLLATHARGAENPAPRPNFVIVLVDDMGYGDIGPFGSTLNKTPRLDRMASEGMRLTSFYAAPVCTPSRAQLLTGCYPKRVSLPAVIFPASPIGLHTNEMTIARLLKGQGYATMAIGKWHVGDQRQFLPTRHGFDHYFGLPYSNDMIPGEKAANDPLLSAGQSPGPVRVSRPGELGIVRGRRPPLPLLRDDKVIETVSAAGQDKLTARYTEEAVNFIRQNRANPFFLYLAHTAVHVPLHPGASFRGQSKNGLYGDWVQEIDWSVGCVLDALRELGLEQNTLVVFTSDNGPWLVKGKEGGVAGPLRDGKGTTWEGGMRVPTIAWWPGKIASGAACDAVMANLDLLPTLVGLAGGRLPTDRKLDGKDIWPLLSGNSTAPVHEAFYYFKGNKLEAVRSGAWKLTLAESGSAPALYNLAQDIGEKRNQAAEQPAIVSRLSNLMSQMDADLGALALGPGVRPCGRVSDPQPLTLAGANVHWEEEPVTPTVPGTFLLKLGDQLDKTRAPRVAAQPVRITGTVIPKTDTGVILAHGGNVTGYALHLEGGRLKFTVREQGRATSIGAPVKTSGKLSFEARLLKGGRMQLLVEGKPAADGNAGSLLPVQPQEDLCVGFDNGQPVGSYPAESRFSGTIEQLTVHTGNP